LELKLNGFISFEERINKKGEELKQTISSIIPVPKAVKDIRLQKGTFDLLIQLDSDKEKLEERQSADRVELKDTDFAEVKAYYSDFGKESTKMMAYHVVANNGRIEECLEEVSRLI
jgi:hypothetical protein